MEGNKIKVSRISEQSESAKKCFLEKANEFGKKYANYLKENNVEVSSLFTIFINGNYIEYGLKDSIKKLKSDFQKDAELFFKEAFIGCLSKYS